MASRNQEKLTDIKNTEQSADNSLSQLVFRRCLKPVTATDIDTIEDWTGFSLPRAYREFLLRWNGGIPNKNCGNTIYLKALYGISAKPSDLQLSLVNANTLNGAYGHRTVPPHILKVGYCDGTDQIWMDLRDGQIFARDGQIDYDERPSSIAEQFRRVEQSFDGFLNSLHGESQFNSPDDERVCIGRWADVKMLDTFLARGGDINSLTGDGGSIVASAIEQGEIEFVDACVKRGAILKDRGLLHTAALSPNVDALEYLLTQGLDVNELIDNRTPLDCTFDTRDWIPVRERLVKHGGRFSDRARSEFEIPRLG